MKRIALFLDVDGTLLDFSPRPEAVVVPPDLPGLLADLAAVLDDALALVSGRRLADVDRLFPGFPGAVVGLHGIEVRPSPGSAVSHACASRPPRPLRDRLDALACECAGAFVEDKEYTLALHLPAGPLAEAEREVLAALDGYGGRWRVLKGHRVLEIRPAGVDKGAACAGLLEAPRFAGRKPVYVGDDVTDLDAFAVIKAAKGTAVAVGPRLAHAGDVRISSPQAARRWLERLLAGARAGETGLPPGDGC